ncbi:MAG: hypothetical protein H8E29_15005 [Anaerolineales bacterium]|uniref:Uncharacterized protein n=1 Tax=Candidatus Desulfolinea nitratireducens TaxID=2841698 RepID=A0A8J6TK65_9CHLR|nr:hypothetical protein [Candidatus Desulfolinea nitratireducens]
MNKKTFSLLPPATRFVWIGLLSMILVVALNLPLSLYASVSGNRTWTLWAASGGWALPALFYLIATLLGIPSLMKGRDFRGTRLQRALGFLGPLAILAGFMVVAHTLDPCHRGWWDLQSRINNLPLCEYYWGEVTIDTRFHWLMHALPDPIFLAGYWLVLRKWHPDFTRSAQSHQHLSEK